MSKSFTIGEVAQILGISTATLRFWEEKKLFFVEKATNRYRCYTPRDLQRIADVLFYRSLGFSIQHMGQMHDWTLEEYTAQIEIHQKQFQAKMLEYQRMYQRSQTQMEHLAEVKRLRSQEPSLEEIPFDAVASFDYQEQDKLLRYALTPSSYIRYYDTNDMDTEARGITIANGQREASLLWQKTPGTQFCTCLIREKADQNYESDVAVQLAAIRRRYHTGRLLSQYLITAKENGERIDYYKGYVEVEPL